MKLGGGLLSVQFFIIKLVWIIESKIIQILLQPIGMMFLQKVLEERRRELAMSGMVRYIDLKY